MPVYANGLKTKLNVRFSSSQLTFTNPSRLVPVIARLLQVQIVANEISAKSKELASVYEASLDSFSPLFYKLTIEFPAELDKYRLDEIAVASIAPTVSSRAHRPFLCLT